MDINERVNRLLDLADRWGSGEQILLNGTMCLQNELREAATAISALQAENEKMRAELERAKEAGFDDAMNAAVCSANEVIMEKELRACKAELEQVKRERDSAILFAQCYTEKVDNPCIVCRHRFNEVGAPLKKRCENCGLTGTPECGWEFDFNWDLKED